jgi:HSP20 family protein
LILSHCQPAKRCAFPAGTFETVSPRVPSIRFQVAIVPVSCYASTKPFKERRGGMSPVRWDPLEDVAMLRDRINRSFDDAFAEDKELEGDFEKYAWRPLVDIFDTGDGLKIKAELSGVPKEDISVELRGNMLTLQGERRCDSNVCDNAYYRKERSYGTFRRTFRIPFDAVPEDIQAVFRDGILAITISRPEGGPARPIAVDVE